MATTTTKSSSSSPTLRFLGFLKQPDPSESDPTNTDLDENDVVWSYIPSPQRPINPNPRRRINPVQSGLSAALKSSDQRQFTVQKPKEIPVSGRPENIPARLNQSAPMNIPVWPKKLREVTEFDGVDEEVEGGGEGDEIVPPHVIVARSHLTFSVFEGVGRTLKGRDLRRVRNAVFRKTGFLD